MMPPEYQEWIKKNQGAILAIDNSASVIQCLKTINKALAQLNLRDFCDCILFNELYAGYIGQELIGSVLDKILWQTAWEERKKKDKILQLTSSVCAGAGGYKNLNRLLSFRRESILIVTDEIISHAPIPATYNNVLWLAVFTPISKLPENHILCRIE